MTMLSAPDHGGVKIEPKWWQNKGFPLLGAQVCDLRGMAQMALTEDALRDGKTLYHNELDGVLEHTTFADLLDKVTALGGRVVSSSPIWRGDTCETAVLVWDDACLEIAVDEGDITFHCVTTDPDLHEALKIIAHDCIGPKVSAGRVYVLITTEEGPKLSSIGVGAIPLERGNYAPEVVAAFDHIVEDLNTASPCGRLVVLDGEPGTGKTFLIRALLHQVPQALFVIVPANLIPELGSPAMVSAMVEARKNKGDLPTIFIVEDADDCLTPRENDNVNAVSALLNLGDGILGAMMDIRLICTTNAKTEDLDEAVTRPGRLCRLVNVGPLPVDIGSKLFEKLTGDAVLLTRDLTLAEIYRLARDRGWKPERKTKTVGFSREKAEARLIRAIESGNETIIANTLEAVDEV